jgi:hypothetical protein
MARPKRSKDSDDSSGSLPRHPGAGARNVLAGHKGAAQAGDRGRSRGSQPSTSPGHAAGSVITQPGGQKGGTPKGKPKQPDPDQNDEGRRSTNRENEVAALLAANGYQTKQNPSKTEIEQARRDHGDHGSPLKDPDYLLEGRVFDCYSPNPATSVRNVWSTVRDKGNDGQTQRVVVDLKEWKGDMSELWRQFHDWTLPKIKEVKVITSDEQIVQVVPYLRNP